MPIDDLIFHFLRVGANVGATFLGMGLGIADGAGNQRFDGVVVCFHIPAHGDAAQRDGAGCGCLPPDTQIDEGSAIVAIHDEPAFMNDESGIESARCDTWQNGFKGCLDEVGRGYGRLPETEEQAGRCQHAGHGNAGGVEIDVAVFGHDKRTTAETEGGSGIERKIPLFELQQRSEGKLGDGIAALACGAVQGFHIRQKGMEPVTSGIDQSVRERMKDECVVGAG